jgi:hypothetical protein
MDARMQIWVQQNKTRWDQNQLLKDQLPYLSPEATDLLNKMFELDELKRIDLRSIKAHPWVQLVRRGEGGERKRVC